MAKQKQRVFKGIGELDFSRFDKVYYDEQNEVTVYIGWYNNYQFLIWTDGMFPRAYVEFVKKDMKLSFIDELKCHGCVTFFDGDLAWITGSRDRHFVGWDYGHFDDYSHYTDKRMRALEDENNRKYTFADCIAECEAVIKQLYGDNIKVG